MMAAALLLTVSERGGFIHVGSYPRAARPADLVRVADRAFDGAFEAEFCQSVRELTELEPREAALDLARRDGAVPARLPLSSLDRALARRGSSARETGLLRLSLGAKESLV